MPYVVTGGAMLQCSFGLAPSTLMVLPLNKVFQTLPVANIMDNKPFVNILPFGMCTSLANPAVASATAAALGVLVPMPCTPMTVAPWSPGSVTVLVGNLPVIDQTSKLICTFGGCIQVISPGQAAVMD
ncbi:DUF4280 domain-containing protein [Desulfoluna sp.]|uniref:DUF4280 domain-containing protein n=1 Tax=Desulfoluna sp. TaxID=2045199 RepID=UPI0026162968|nr:DUF4280 domain-containing protein [Desulfoluna sp.]